MMLSDPGLQPYGPVINMHVAATRERMVWQLIARRGVGKELHGPE